MQRHPQKQLADLLKVMTREYAAEGDLDTTQISGIKLEDFYEWWRPRRQGLLDRDDELRRNLRLDEGVVQAMHDAFDNPWTACLALLPIWPVALLSGRPPIKDPPWRIDVAIQLTWRDGQTRQLGGATGWRDDEIIGDGEVVATARQMLQAICTDMGRRGVASLLTTPPMQERRDLGASEIDTGGAQTG